MTLRSPSGSGSLLFMAFAHGRNPEEQSPLKTQPKRGGPPGTEFPGTEPSSLRRKHRAPRSGVVGGGGGGSCAAGKDASGQKAVALQGHA